MMRTSPLRFQRNAHGFDSHPRRAAAPPSGPGHRGGARRLRWHVGPPGGGGRLQRRLRQRRRHRARRGLSRHRPAELHRGHGPGREDRRRQRPAGGGRRRHRLRRFGQRRAHGAHHGARRRRGLPYRGPVVSQALRPPGRQEPGGRRGNVPQGPHRAPDAGRCRHAGDRAHRRNRGGRLRCRHRARRALCEGRRRHGVRRGAGNAGADPRHRRPAARPEADQHVLWRQDAAGAAARPGRDGLSPGDHSVGPATRRHPRHAGHAGGDPRDRRQQRAGRPPDQLQGARRDRADPPLPGAGRAGAGPGRAPARSGARGLTGGSAAASTAATAAGYSCRGACGCRIPW